MALSQQQYPFSIESFTYSWCLNLAPPSLESLSNSLRFSLDHTLSDYFDIDLLNLVETKASGDQNHSDTPLGVSEWSSANSDQSGSSSRMKRSKSFVSKKILKRYLGLILRKFISRRLLSGGKSRKRMSSKVDDVVDDRSFNSRASLRNSCDSEASIYEAVLHCKRSIHKP